MKTKLEQVLIHCLNGREVAVWGQPTRLLARELRDFPWHVAETVDASKHYVVAVTDDDLTDFLRDEQSAGFRDVWDYICFADQGKELPFEWTCYGTPVGKQTYFGEKVASACENGYIERIGAFTSINSTARIHVDHHMNMSFISDEVVDFLNEENWWLFDRLCEADPKHPYALGKSKLTIGSDVWIGSGAFIDCSKVTTIGDGAVIGANAVVLEDVPPYAVVAGVPAKIKKYRYEPEMIEALLRTRWWDWDEENLNRNADALFDPCIFLKRFGEAYRKREVRRINHGADL